VKPRLDIAGLVAGIALALTAGCATGPQQCTAERLSTATQTMFDQYADSHAASIKSLHRDLADISAGGSNGAARFSAAFFAGEFRASLIPQIDRMTARCSSPPNDGQIFAAFLRRAGFSELELETFETLGVLMDRKAWGA
jgi:hypothetical protein